MKIVLPFVFVSMLALQGCSKKEPAESGKMQQGNGVAAASLNISGTIQIDPKLSPMTKSSDVIFLIAKPATGGPPLAVKKFTGKNYPIEFEITNQDLMMQQDIPDVPLNLTVRVDKDGDAMSKNPGDLTGSYEKNPAPIQMQGVQITITEIIK